MGKAENQKRNKRALKKERELLANSLISRTVSFHILDFKSSNVPLS